MKISKTGLEDRSSCNPQEKGTTPSYSHAGFFFFVFARLISLLPPESFAGFNSTNLFFSFLQMFHQPYNVFQAKRLAREVPRGVLGGGTIKFFL